MKNKHNLVLLIIILNINFCFGQSKKSQKIIKKLINDSELVLFESGKFTAGKCSVFDKKKLNSDQNLHFQEIPSRETCSSFLLCNHEVTVAEYLKFVFAVSGKSTIKEVSETVDYSFSLNEVAVRVSILPKIPYINGKNEAVYLQDEKYANHPVIGVSWLQANAYIHWLNQQIRQTLNEGSIPNNSVQFILPDHLQWEYACIRPFASDAKERLHAIEYYPWDSNELLFEDGSYRANFGQIETKNGVILKNYAADQFLLTAPVKSYKGSHNGLFDMAGNVAEWTSTIAVNTDSPNSTDRNFMVKGGSYRSAPIFMQTGISQIYPEALQSNEIGFRVAMIIDETILAELKKK